MRATVRSIVGSLGAAVAAFLSVAPAVGATIDLEWNPGGQDVVGYRIYKGSQPDLLAFALDVPRVESAPLGGLTACSYYYIAVKAVDDQGLISEEYSNIVEGYPHPEIVSVTPSVLRRGASATLVVTGSSFVTGAVPSFDGRRVQVRSSRIDACGRMTLEVAIPKTAPEGPAAFTISNPDGGFGTSTAAFRVVAEGTGDPLEVLSVTPAPGATNVDPAAPIRVRFSAAVDPASLSLSRFRIAKSDGRGAARLTGVPVLDATGTWVTLTPAAPLQAGASYEVVVKGGRTGVHDVLGNPIDANFAQDPGFTTRPLVSSLRFGPADQVAASGAILEDGASVPALSGFVVRFTEPMNPATIGPKTFRIRKTTNGKVQLMDGQPLLLADGVSVLMVPAEPLEPSQTFEIVVKGGRKGVASARGVVMASARSASFTTALGVVDGLGVAE